MIENAAQIARTRIGLTKLAELPDHERDALISNDHPLMTEPHPHAETQAAFLVAEPAYQPQYGIIDSPSITSVYSEKSCRDHSKNPSPSAIQQGYSALSIFGFDPKRSSVTFVVKRQIVTILLHLDPPVASLFPLLAISGADAGAFSEIVMLNYWGKRIDEISYLAIKNLNVPASVTLEDVSLKSLEDDRRLLLDSQTHPIFSYSPADGSYVLQSPAEICVLFNLWQEGLATYVQAEQRTRRRRRRTLTPLSKRLPHITKKGSPGTQSGLKKLISLAPPQKTKH